MKISEIPHGCDQFFLNGDFISTDNYVIINDREEVFRNGKLLEIKGMHSFEFSTVSIISSELFILVDGGKHSNYKESEDNAWIINDNGDIIKSFYLGNVHRMITTKNYIICSYTDAELDTNWKYGQNGLVVFDYDGKSQFEYYRDELKYKWLRFIENYAFLKKDENTIYYMPYDGFPIVEFNLSDFSSKVVFQIPDPEELNNNLFWNPKAFSQKGNDWYFITPNFKDWNSIIFKMDHKKQIEQQSITANLVE